MAGGPPWVWFISPEMAMFVGLARDWLAFVVAIILSGEEDRVSYRKRDNKYRKWVTDQIKIGATKALTYLEKLMIQSLGTSRSRRRSQSSCRSTSRRSGGRQRDLSRRKQWARTSGMVVAMLVTTSQGRQAAAFDSDSFKLYVDNCASKCITNNIDDFIRAPQKVRGRVKSFDGNKVSVHAVGTIKWDFEDENGTAHSFLIPGSLYVPSAPARLFSPQHWAQEQKDHYPSKDGTWCTTFSDHVLLEWGQRKFRRVVKFDQANVASFMSAPGSKRYKVFRAIFDATDESIEETIAFNTTVVTDDEEDWINKNDDDDDKSDDESQSGTQHNRRCMHRPLGTRRCPSGGL